MDILNEDLNDSALVCLSLIQKRKASGSSNPKKPKQKKLDIVEPSSFTGNGDLDNLSQAVKSNLEESTSSYFEKTEKAEICPRCLEPFKSESNFMGHIKQCTKQNPWTPKQLLNALKLQKEHLKERSVCAQIGPPKRRTPITKKEDDTDLALGLALSESLSSSESKPRIVEFRNEPGPSRKKNRDITFSVLRNRTAEERQRIMTEKAAFILADKGIVAGKKQWIVNYNLKNHHLANLLNLESYLWSLGENEETNKWYVKNIKNLIVEEKEAESAPNPPECTVKEEVFKYNLPKADISEDWKKMIDNNKMSDFTGKTKDCQTFYLHSLVLLARCPQILEKDLESIFQKYNKSTILIFLEYLYCGTLNGLCNTELKNVSDLAVNLNYTDLIIKLSCLEDAKDSEEIIPSGFSSNPEVDIDLIENKKVSLFTEDRDIFEQVVDLTQSSHSSASEGRKESLEDESNVDKSYWSFLQNEKEREQSEEIRKQEDEKEKTLMEICESQREKISDEFEKEELCGSNKLELTILERRESNESATKDLTDEFKKDLKTCDSIIISSDSETGGSKTEEGNLAKSIDLHFEAPYFDPYDDLNFSENHIARSPSLITGDVSHLSLNFNNDRIDEEPKKERTPLSTPVNDRRTPRVQSTVKKLLNKSQKKRSDLSTNHIIRKSLGLELKARKSRVNSSKKKKVRRSKISGKKDFADALANSILNEFSNCHSIKSSTPVRKKNFTEMTPFIGGDNVVSCETPSPNYSKMGESLLKEHLSKYGVKKSLGKSKAKKILRHIYDELHPKLNVKTGEIVKIPANDNPPKSKKIKPKSTWECKNGGKTIKKDCMKKKEEDYLSQMISPEDCKEISFKSISSSDRSTNQDSFEDSGEILTQSVSPNPLDLFSAFNDFLEKNPEFHKKILLYEPVWLEELHKNLKETFKRNFKLTDLKDFLDQMCVTFRSEAQKKSNQKKNEKKVKSPRKKCFSQV